MRRELIVINQVGDFDRLLDRGPRARALKVAIKSVSEAKQQEMERKLNAVYNACGCTETSICIMAGILIGISCYFVFDKSQISLLAFSAAIFIGAAVFGRFLGKWRARKHLRAAISMYKNELTDS